MTQAANTNYTHFTRWANTKLDKRVEDGNTSAKKRACLCTIDSIGKGNNGTCLGAHFICKPTVTTTYGHCCIGTQVMIAFFAGSTTIAVA